jgi:hypothetical protein
VEEAAVEALARGAGLHDDGGGARVGVAPAVVGAEPGLDEERRGEQQQHDEREPEEELDGGGHGRSLWFRGTAGL